MIARRLLPVVVLMISGFAGAQEAACTCEAQRGAGVVWSDTEPIGLERIARLGAPILWFSRDEPLLELEGVSIPEPHPCDAPSEEAVVYYQATQIGHRGQSVARPEEDDPAFFDKVDRMILKYFFYYREDFGLGGHRHDLEAVELEVDLSNEGGCYQVRIETATALAHGSRWYSNILDVTEDTRFPLTVFVEEGKHGSALDRNADGYFTRGYDVNQRVNDAWGVRDVMGSGVLLSSAYNAEMTKPRLFEHRMLPPDNDLVCVPPSRSSLQLEEGYLGHYRLRPGNRVPRCAAVDEDEHLASFAKYHQFGEHQLPNQFSAGGIDDAFRKLGTPDSFVSVSLRTEGRLGAALVFRGLDLRQGWIVPKINVNDVFLSAGLMYTPSASRFFDYYLAGGLRWQYDSFTETITVDTPEGPRDVDLLREPEWRAYTETGIRIRARVPSKMRPFVLGYTFAGIRAGVQAVGVGSLEDIRLVFEIGAGAW